MVGRNDIPPALFQVLERALFQNVDVDDDVKHRVVEKVIANATEFHARTVTLLLDELKPQDDASIRAAALRIAALHVRFTTHEKAQLTTAQKTKLRDKVEEAITHRPDVLLAVARLNTGMTQEADSVSVDDIVNAPDPQTDKPDSEQEGASGPTNGPPGQNGGTCAMTLDQLLDVLVKTFAFDETQLPQRLHYQKANGVATDLSAGQLALLRGALRALQKLVSSRTEDGEEAQVPKTDLAAAVIGLLLHEGNHDPDDFKFFEHVKAAYSELLEPASPTQSSVVMGNEAFEHEFEQKQYVFEKTIEVLRQRQTTGRIFFNHFASVGRLMAESFDRRPPGKPGFANAVYAHYDQASLRAGRGGDGGGSGTAFLDLPPLNDPAGESGEIVEENIRAVSAIYTVYQCEQMMVFAVTDRIVELFMAGLLPMRGDGLARLLDDYYYSSEDRVSQAGRNARYTLTLGVAGGDPGPDVTANAEFETHAMRVVSSIAEHEREHSAAHMFDGTGRRVRATNGEYVRKAIRDLAANATLYGYAGTQFAAERMGKHLRQAMNILQLPRIRDIYGVNTMYQVIERVAQSEFGVSVNIVKHRTAAEEMRNIFEVIATNRSKWSLTTGEKLFTNHIGDEAPSSLDFDTSQRLIRAAQYILAVNGIQGSQVTEYSQPVETPALPSLPGVGNFLGSGNANSTDGDVSGRIKDMLSRGETPTGDQLRSMIGI